jgi:hypothetical protein
MLVVMAFDLSVALQDGAAVPGGRPQSVDCLIADTVVTTMAYVKVMAAPSISHDGLCKSNSSTKQQGMQRHPSPACKAAHSCKAAHASKASLTHCNAPLTVNAEQVDHSYVWTFVCWIVKWRYGTVYSTHTALRA